MISDYHIIDPNMKKFQKRVENFTCEVCKYEAIGSGYTNHCPNCLWSKHVDISPGDRENSCQGLMKPIGLDQKSGKFIIIHRCQKCGEIKRNKVSPKDNQQVLRELVKQAIITNGNKNP